jgi:hypothetical protein
MVTNCNENGRRRRQLDAQQNVHFKQKQKLVEQKQWE